MAAARGGTLPLTFTLQLVGGGHDLALQQSAPATRRVARLTASGYDQAMLRVSHLLRLEGLKPFSLHSNANASSTALPG